jgi:N-acyl-D-aspartate/D-glutamate deacylase
MTNFDVVIRGGTVFDGTGAVPTVADVGVRDGKVAAMLPANG